VSTPTLVTIPPSHFCEKARWALEYAGVTFVEEPHAPMVHWAFVLPRTGTRTVPVLLRDGQRPLTSSHDILCHCDTLLPEAARLYPEPHAAAVGALEDELDRGLGVQARRLAYCFVARSASLFRAGFSSSLPRTEATVVDLLSPVLRFALGRAFKVSDSARARTQEKVDRTFDDVARRLDGRTYLIGDRFTAADLTFVALASPVLAPGRDLTPLRASDPEYVALVERFRAHPAGEYAERIRTRHRGASHRASQAP
jgi:glutathione S-transferase